MLLVDTPCIDDTHKRHAYILKLIAAFLATTQVQRSTYQFHWLDFWADTNTDSGSWVIYIHRIPDRRFTGIAGGLVSSLHVVLRFGLLFA